MLTARQPSLIQAGARCSALLMLVACLLAAAAPSPRSALAVGCAGDEQLWLAPLQPRAGSVLLVAAVSTFPHEQALLLGPDGLLAAQREAVGDLFIWQATVVPTHGGEHRFSFGVADSVTMLTACANALTVVADADAADADAAAPPADGAPDGVTSSTPVSSPFTASALFSSLHPWARDGSLPAAHVGQRGPAATEPPATDVGDGSAPADEAGVGANSRAARSSRQSRSSSRSSGSADNGNENDNEAEPTPTRTSTPTRTPTPTKTPTVRPTSTETPVPTPTLAPPSIGSLSPEVVVCGETLTIRGQRFGDSRTQVNGKVRIDDRDATIVSWSMSSLEVRVPQGARPGNDRLLEVIIAENTAQRYLRILC